MNFVNKHLAGQAVSAGSWGPTGSRREGVSARRRRLMPLWFIGWLAMVAGLLGAPVATAQTPLGPATCPTALTNCTANEVTTTVLSVSVLNNDSCSGPNDTIQLQLDLSFDGNGGSTRYDFGLFVSKDGGNIQAGNPPQAAVCTAAMAPIPPFIDYNNTTPASNNICGDIKGSDANTLWSVTTTVACNAVGGVLTIPSCRVWDQNKKNPDVCTSLADVAVGTGAKCDCSPFTVPDITFGTLTVIKQLDPTNDPGLFNLTIDGVVNATNVGHNGTTGAVTVSTGSHTVGETAGTNTNLANYDTTYSCSINGGPATPGPTTTVNAGQNTTCTITNTNNTVPVCRMVRLRSSGAVTPPGAALFGTGQLNGTCSGTSCSLAINTIDGMFSGKGLIYNDGQFPVSGACNAATEECFPTQSNTAPSANPFPTTSPGFDLTNLALTPGNAGGTITFTSSSAYSYTGGKFTSHTGTYTTLDCANTVPEPRTLMLVLPLVLALLSLSGLGWARRRPARQRSG